MSALTSDGLTLLHRRLILRLGIVGTLATLLSGCIAIPIYAPLRLRSDSSVRGPIPKHTLAFLTAGTTTRTEVLLRLGLPDNVLDDDRQFEYVWGVETMTGGLLLLSIQGATGLGGSLFEQHRLVLDFDQAGILRKRDHQITVNWK